MQLAKVLAREFPLTEHTITPRDCMLYSLGVGVGDRPNVAEDLQFVYEDKPGGLKVFPAMVNVICHPGPWVKEPELEIEWVKLLHGEQSFTIHRPLEPGRTYVGAYRVANVIDKGEGKGAMLYLEKTLSDKLTQEKVATVLSTYVLRGDGGCGGTTTEVPAVHPIPDTPPADSISLTTLPQSGLIYRLSGDYNPIHASPEIARKAGFDRPILHGLCTMGVATRAILQALCDDQPERLRSVSLRFSSPVYPGETIMTEFWKTASGVSFRATATERKVVVLNFGHAQIA
ncbi:3-alpha,7-alpha,12-alpha-trihydroxy-5-beta-cholest-24-enoyl-CoA hydratase (plasmid) [Diaphorobacter sp. HDW4B]|uniref:MaoC/PaaZ C-terminal domain-containing protein n=1 Tax=Diaphorobacter sp. HDW4B TaxID=2714925 RepID=UPI001407FBDB|nr:MaoC/PaaZ C-terminal domain-containing protein [Diaphorobacter sp. HDW4B]QIL73975.1 3-alpha,7-alpha,12-alpha-trihydroxy-5-beta-cholest-24-enoyl-CoA hydratase [Diaphorobacter sp. HDW4B]